MYVWVIFKLQTVAENPHAGLWACKAVLRHNADSVLQLKGSLYGNMSLM